MDGHEDFLGRCLAEGDTVVLITPNYREYELGTVVGFTQCFVVVQREKGYTIKQSGSQLIKTNC